MTIDPAIVHRLRFLLRVVRREADHLSLTDARLFSEPFTVDRAEHLLADPDLAERVEAFVGRFARLQDTLGDKALPLVLSALGERSGAAIDNLDLAERLGFVDSVDDWLAMRALRNQMVHEYVEDLTILTSALASAHAFVPSLISAVIAIEREAERRRWLEDTGVGEN